MQPSSSLRRTPKRRCSQSTIDIVIFPPHSLIGNSISNEYQFKCFLKTFNCSSYGISPSINTAELANKFQIRLILKAHQHVKSYVMPRG